MPGIDALMRQGLISPDAAARFMSDASPDPVQAGQQYAANTAANSNIPFPKVIPLSLGPNQQLMGGARALGLLPSGAARDPNDILEEIQRALGPRSDIGQRGQQYAADYRGPGDRGRSGGPPTFPFAGGTGGGSLNVTGRGAQRFSNQVSLDAANRDVPQPTLPKLRFMENEPSRELMEGSNKPVMGRPVGSGRQWSDAEIAHLTDGLNAGKSGRMIAEELGLPESQVRAQIQRSGLKSRADTTNRKYLP